MALRQVCGPRPPGPVAALHGGGRNRIIPPDLSSEGVVEKRTLGIILTVVTVLFCGCPGLGLCLAGGITAAGYGNYAMDLQGRSGVLPTGYGYGMLCAGLIAVAIPIVIGIVMLRKPKSVPPADNVPPAA
jgi:hypothetical protein